MQELISQFGYLAVFVGTLLEGETVLALAGAAAAQGYLSFPAVLAIAVAGAFLGDQICFFLGRRYGPRIVARFPRLAAQAPRVQALLRRWDAAAVILLRFLYGLRIAGPILIGACDVSPWRVALFNFVGVLLWAPLVAGAGYAAGYAVHEWIGHVKDAQVGLLALAALGAALAWWLLRRKRAQRHL